MKRLRNRPNTPAMVHLPGDMHDGRVVTVCRLVFGDCWTTEPMLEEVVGPDLVATYAWHDSALIPLAPPEFFEELVQDIAAPVREGVQA